MTTTPPPYTGTVGTPHGPQTPDHSIQLTHITAAELARLSKAFLRESMAQTMIMASKGYF